MADELKKAAALAAVELIPDKAIVGLGSGSTVGYFLEALAERVRTGKLDVVGVPTSYATRFMARGLGIPIYDPIDVDAVDIAVDGADEVDPNGSLIKGGGGAHVLEKLVAAMSGKFVVIVDETKLVDILGVNFRVPVEVISPAISYVMRSLKEMGAEASIRYGSGKLGHVVSDLGNVLIDVDFGAIRDVPTLDKTINGIPGVIGHGLFVGLQDEVVIAHSPEDSPRIETRKYERAT